MVNGTEDTIKNIGQTTDLLDTLLKQMPPLNMEAVNSQKQRQSPTTHNIVITQELMFICTNGNSFAL